MDRTTAIQCHYRSELSSRISSTNHKVSHYATLCDEETEWGRWTGNEYTTAVKKEHHGTQDKEYNLVVQTHAFFQSFWLDSKRQHNCHCPPFTAITLGTWGLVIEKFSRTKPWRHEASCSTARLISRCPVVSRPPRGYFHFKEKRERGTRNVRCVCYVQHVLQPMKSIKLATLW